MATGFWSCQGSHRTHACPGVWGIHLHVPYEDGFYSEQKLFSFLSPHPLLSFLSLIAHLLPFCVHIRKCSSAYQPSRYSFIRGFDRLHPTHHYLLLLSLACMFISWSYMLSCEYKGKRKDGNYAYHIPLFIILPPWRSATAPFDSFFSEANEKLRIVDTKVEVAQPSNGAENEFTFSLSHPFAKKL